MSNSPASPWGWVLLNLRVRLERARATDERGASAIEWVIITAVVVAIAAAIATVVWNYVNTQSNEIQNTEIPSGP